MITTNIDMNNKEAGAGLIAMAFLILVLGFAGTTAIYLYQNYNLVEDDQTSVDNSRQIQAAIMAFVNREGRYPCPAPLNADIDTEFYGKEVTSTQCVGGALGSGTFRALGRDNETVRVGTVPTRSLNISDELMVDGYGKRYVYAVTERMATPGTNPKSEQGVISVTNDGNHHMTSSEGNAIFALISFGTDERGAYDVSGNLITPCSEDTTAGNNCKFQTTPNTEATFMTTMSKSYGSADESFEHNFAFFANDPLFRWVTSDWDNCDGICITGTQDRTAQCQNIESGAVINVANADLDNAVKNPCIHSPKPEITQTCPLGPCKWRRDVPWGACQAGSDIRIPDRSNCS